MTHTPPDVKSIFGRALEIESPAARAAYLAEACGTDRIRYHYGMFAVRNARAVPRNASPTPDAALGWPMQTTSACKRSGATISDGLASGGVRLALLKPNAR